MPPKLEIEPTKPEDKPTTVTFHLIVGFCGLALASAAISGGLLASHRSMSAVIKPDHPRHLADFTLTDRSGRIVQRSELRDHYCIVGFVFTSCGSTCLLVSRQLEEIQRLTEGQNDVRLVSFTVDPRTDTPPVLTKFAASFNADPNRWLFLTGNKSDILPVIETSFLPKAIPGDERFSDLFLNTDRIVLLDTDGRVRAYFDGKQPGAARAVVTELRHLRTTHDVL